MSYDFFMREFEKCRTVEELDKTEDRLRAKLNAEFVDQAHPELRESLTALESAYREARAMLPTWLEERRQVEAEEQENEEQDHDD
jgi:hypothetical protein